MALLRSSSMAATSSFTMIPSFSTIKARHCFVQKNLLDPLGQGLLEIKDTHRP